MQTKNIFYINKIIILIFLLLVELNAGDKRLNVTYISHFHSKQVFGQSVHSFAKAVANDLNINLKIALKDNRINRNLNRFEYLQFLDRELSVSPKPDFALVIFFKGISKQILELSKKHNVPVMIVNTNIPKRDIDDVGEPRKKYDNFIGLIASDEKQAGYDIGQHLINKANKINPNRNINIIAIAGPKESPESDSRILGLENAVKNNKNSKIIQVLHANWDKDTAYKQMKQLLERYNDIDIVWCASDGMSLGALKAIKEKNLTNSIVTGGIDWTSDGLESIKNNGMSVSAGGHFMNGGFALLLLHDYYFGSDFKTELGTQVLSKMSILANNNISNYLNKFGKSNWDDIDFTKFSKVLNSDNKKYDFSVENLYKHMNN